MAIKVLIVDDSAVVRQTMSEILQSDPDITIIGTAADPLFAQRKMEQDMPDVITLDIEMPRMDGLSFLHKIMTSEHPIPVIVCSSKLEADGDNLVRASEYGAAVIIEKPKIGTKVFLQESKVRICDAVKEAYASRYRFLRKNGADELPVHTSAEKPAAAPAAPKKSFFGAVAALDTTEKIVVVGASTGGTEALREFLEALPEDSPGIVIVQHMPEHFTRAFAQRLDTLCKVTVKEAEHNDTVLPGRVLIAPGNRHALLKRSGARYYVEVKDGPLVSRHRPSVDVLFRSAARYAGKNAIGVIMTGMGNDGAVGMTEMHDAGAYTIAQNESSCVVFGMPCEAIKKGAVDQVCPLDEIAGAVLHARLRH